MWLAEKTEDCKSVSPLFSYKLDRRLTLKEKIRVKIHLFTCGACLNYVSNLKFMHEVFHEQEKNFQEEKLAESLQEDSKDRIKKFLKAEM